MKTLQELYNEVRENDELKKKFSEAAKAGRLTEFVRENGCGAAAEEITAFMAAGKENLDGLLSAEELAAAAGGGKCDKSDCDHHGWGGEVWGFKKDYAHGYWYEAARCGNCGRTHYRRYVMKNSSKSGTWVEVSSSEYNSVKDIV